MESPIRVDQLNWMSKIVPEEIRICEEGMNLERKIEG